MKVEPVVLEGRSVRLEPLRPEHAPGLLEVSLDESIWRYMPFRMSSLSDAEGWVQFGQQCLASGDGVCFAMIERETGRVVGSTSFMAASPANLRVEIGGTWVTPERQRSPVNTEAKYLMLSHAFETWGCNRVEFKTDSRNQKSRNALLRIGAQEEGTLRAHMVMPDGHLRDSVYFSVVAPEWPGVRAALEAKLT